MLAAPLWLLILGIATAASPPPVTLTVFTREGCPHCRAAHAYIEALAERTPWLIVEEHDVVRDPSARDRLRRALEAAAVPTLSVPVFVVGDKVVVGFDRPGTTGARIEQLVSALRGPPTADAAACPVETETPCATATPGPPIAECPDCVTVPFLGRVSVDRVTLPGFTLLVGLLDGFNPCAMWVLLFLLSILVNLKDRSKVFVVGGTFVLISGLVYFAFMAAWLNVFLLVGFSRAGQVVLGLVALAIGAINVKDFFAFKVGLSLSIPESAKPGIYARVRDVVQAPRTAGALLAVAGLALLVNTVELLCTAGLPAIYTQVLASKGLSWWRHYSYLALYNAAYMADDALMLGIAVVTLERRKLHEKEGRALKLVSGAVMVALGVLLILRPDWLP